jgi:glycosyltransferase involved in cell wall biosynthesis
MPENVILASPGKSQPMSLHQSLSVTISVRGRFHAFDLARQLQQRGALRRLITTYPKFKIREWDIPDDRTSSFVAMEVLNRLIHRAPIAPSLRNLLGVRLSEGYDHRAAKLIPEDTRLFVGWSSECIESLRMAKALGARTVVERGSCHIRFQDEVLGAEYARLGFPWPGIHPEVIHRNEQEYEEADFISVPSRFVRDTFAPYGVSLEKILVVPYGSNLSVFRPGPKLDQKFRVIHCGQISIRKGVHLLIRAFAELRLPDAELWLIGGLSPEIASILKQYPDSPISVKGPFPQSSLPQYYSQGSVFCIASLEEGLAQVIPQAMGCGLPVIATSNSGGAELVEEGRTGFVIPAGDVDALKEKLLLFYENPQLREDLAANLRKATKLDLSWARYGDQIVNVYEAIVR